MKSLHLFIILILLILVVYYYNKSAVYEKVEHFDDSVINQLASIINDNKIILKDVDINGTLAVNNIKCLGGDNKIHMLNTLTIDKGDLDVPNTLTVNNINKIDKKGTINVLAPMKVNGMLESRDIKTRILHSTGENGNYINFNCGLYSPGETIIGCKSGKSKTSNFKLEMDGNQNNRQPVSIYGNGYVGIP